MAVDRDPDLERLDAAAPSRLADTVAAALDPPILVLVILVAVSLNSSGSVPQAALWAALAGIFCVALPYLVLLILVGRGRILDRHVVIRGQRRWPLAAALASVVAGILLLTALGAPRQVRALVLAMLAGLALMTAISHWYKASFHAAVGAGAAAITAITFGPRTLLATLPLLALLAWARTRAGRHTAAQILTGLLAGAASALAVYPIAGG